MEVRCAVSIEPSDNFTPLDELDRTEFHSTFNAIHVPTSTEVRLTRMSAEISASPEFRAAFRKDEASLRSLRHANVLPLLFWGDDSGHLFYATERPDGQSLSRRLHQHLQFQWDEFTDIGWQIASAIQHAHNRGITHGGLTADWVILSDDCVVQVMSFGLYHWIAEASEVRPTPPAFHTLVEQDLILFGDLLSILLAAVDPASDPPANVQQLADVRSLIQTLKDPHQNLIARDVQGILGDMLLKVSGDSIEMIDYREGQKLSRRSIVDELFDDETTEEPDKEQRLPPSPPSHGVRGIRFWIITAVVITLALIFVIASRR